LSYASLIKMTHSKQIKGEETAVKVIYRVVKTDAFCYDKAAFSIERNTLQFFHRLVLQTSKVRVV